MKNRFALLGLVTLSFGCAGTTLFAADKPTDDCMTAMDAVVSGAPKKGDYTDAVLDHLHDELYRANKIETSDTEMIFCRLTKVLGVVPDLSTLTTTPVVTTKVDPRGTTIAVSISTPTEAWATAAGYTAKATITSDGTQFLALWWTGTGDATKGYVIQGSDPMQADSTKRLRYATWDKTTADQTVKVYAAQFATSFLGSVSGAADSKTGGDNAHFARVNFNSTTKVVKAQSIELRQGRSATTAFKCVRTYFTGTIGGSIDGYRPAQGTEEAVTETATGGASAIGGLGMDGEIKITDAKTTADHSGTASPGTALATGTFDWSCNDLNGAGGTGKAFASNAVTFTTDPTTLFPK